MFVSAILAAGGRGARLGGATPKQLLALGDRTILQRSFDTLDGHERIDEIVIALPAELLATPPAFLASANKPVRIVDGGQRRHDSVAHAFAQISPGADVIVIHDAARPFATPALFSRVIEVAVKEGAAIAAMPSSDTVKEAAGPIGARTVKRTLDRDAIYLAQTPQAFTRKVLTEAIAVGRRLQMATDEASLAERAGYGVRLVEGEPGNIKITTVQDLEIAAARVAALTPNPQPPIPRVGIGYDLHRLEPGRPLIIGGVEIPHEMGLIGHSDADVLCHAVTDAILGGAAAGDIGQHFPDTDPRWKGANSIELLKRAVEIVRGSGFVISNIDAVVIAERPRLLPHVAAIRERLAAAIGIDVAAVSVKGKTNEHVGSLGRSEAIAVHAVALLALSPKR